MIGIIPVFARTNIKRPSNYLREIKICLKDKYCYGSKLLGHLKTKSRSQDLLFVLALLFGFIATPHPRACADYGRWRSRHWEARETRVASVLSLVQAQQGEPKNPSQLAWIFSFVPQGTTSFDRRSTSFRAQREHHFSFLRHK